MGGSGGTQVPREPPIPVSGLRAAMVARADAATPASPDRPVPAEVGIRRRRMLADLASDSIAGLWDEVTAGIETAGLALVAAGSVGRGTPGPLSDLDLIVVHDGRRGRETDLERLAEALWYPIWDAGVALDHSVRSVAQWRAVAGSDLPAAVGMFDVRCVAGDADLVAEAGTAMLGDWRVAARTRLSELLDSITEREERTGELAYLIEPDVKEARGGIRDGVVLDALAATWLTDRPHGAVDDAIAFILDTRDVIQLSTGRRTNRLSRADLDAVASRSGYPGPDDFLAALAEAGRRVTYSLDVTARRAERELRPQAASARPRIIRGRRLPPRLPLLADGLAEYNGELVLASGASPDRDPLLSLRAAATAVTSGAMISPVTAENLGRSGALPEPWPASARADLMTLLASGPTQIPVWGALDLAGAVVRWIPEWAGIRNRMQRAPVHHFTVDRHIIEVVAQLAPDGGAGEDLSAPITQVRYLSALLHDIGKRPGVRDHSEEGARLVPGILRRMGWDGAVIADVARLVRHHLTLSELAVGRDPDDPAVVDALVHAVDARGDLLAVLRDLTRADTAALGERRWTNWRAQLVDELVERTRPFLR